MRHGPSLLLSSSLSTLALLTGTALAAAPTSPAATSSEAPSNEAPSAAPAPTSAEASAAASAEQRVALAERLAQAAFEAYQRRHYPRAIELYQRAWAAAPSADIAFNIARVYDRGLQDPRAALEHYQRCAEHPSALPERRRSAERRIEELKRALAEADPAVAQPEAQPPSQGPAARALPARSGSVPPASAASSRWTATEIAGLAVGGAGVGALGVGLGFALAAHSERSEWERDCDGNACSSQRAVNAARSAGRKADIATVALASGAGMLGIGAALWWLGSESSESVPRAELRSTALGTDLTLTVSGRF